MADVDQDPCDFINIHLDYENVEEMRKVFQRFSKESKVIQKLENTYWGAEFGVIKDKFGVTWQFHFSLPNSK